MMTWYGTIVKVGPCPNCGLRMYKKDNVCPHCGHALSADEIKELQDFMKSERKEGIRLGIIYFPIVLIFLYIIFDAIKNG